MSAQWWDESGPMAPLHDFHRCGSTTSWTASSASAPAATAARQGCGSSTLGNGGGCLPNQWPVSAHRSPGSTPRRRRWSGEGPCGGRRSRHRLSMQDGRVPGRPRAFRCDLCFEVIEHVTDERLFARAIAAMLAPGGTVIITTINRTLASLALAKVALEYVFGLCLRERMIRHASSSLPNCGPNLPPPASFSTK